MNHPMSDAGIPLLTEVITPAVPPPVVQQADATELPRLDRMPDATDASPATVDPESPPPASAAVDGKPDGPIDFENWERLERQIRERITARLHAKIDAVVEQRMEEALADLLQIAVESLTSEVRQSLHQAISDTVSQAVAAEISLMKEQK